MNPDQLLAHYEKIADAPEAVARLRRFVLDLAVRGKLVPQDPNDEPASELLKRIETEKARLVKAKEIKKPKPLPLVDEPLFEIPPTWRWTMLGIVAAYIQRGKSPKYAATEGSPVVSQKCVQWRGLDLSVAKLVTLDSLSKYEPYRFLRDGDLLWNSTGTGTIGRVIRLADVPDRLVCDSHVTVVRCLEVEPEYIRTWLRTDHVYGVIEERASGSTNQVELTATMANGQLVPLPPLAEQHRIVARVDELMVLLDRLEAASEKREVTRNRLAAASLARLNQLDPDADLDMFAVHARFALDNLAALTTRADQIKQLRQTILNLAVRGKLVPQDPSDELAYKLLKSISENKEALVTEVEMKKEKRLPVLKQGEEPFTLPPSWLWTPLLRLVFRLGDGLHGTPVYTEGGKIPFINGNNLVNRKIVIKANTKAVSEGEYNKHKKPLTLDTVLVSINGTLGNFAFYDGEEVVLGKSACYLNLSPLIDKEYVRVVIESPYFQEYAAEKATGTTIKNFSLKAMAEFLVPLPPLAEQGRIVSKVDRLMALCDRLEANLDQSVATRRRLLDALLHDALASETRELEAAE